MLLRLDKISLAYGSRALLDQASLQLDAGERVGLVGRNGEGKSSLLRLLYRQSEPDSGSIWLRPGARLAYLVQDVSSGVGDTTVAQLVTTGLAAQAAALDEYQELAAVAPLTTEQHRRLDQLHRELDASDGWHLQQRVGEILSRLQLDPEARFEQLSGGWRRRALLAAALVCQPDVLLLDEPTNHLDIDAIEWLEGVLLGFGGALLFVSHDRTFINHIATRIVELDRGSLLSIDGNFDDYHRLKEQQLAAETQQQALFDKKLAAEEVWIRRGVEARRTRNEGRVRALYALREQRRDRRDRTGQVELEQHTTEASGELVFEARHVDIAFGDRTIVRDFNARIQRGERIGLIGPNGAGKSTLIKALLGELPVTRGELVLGSKLRIAYYDQERAQLDLDESVMRNISGDNDFVSINGESRHVSGYLRDFLFRPDQLQTPVRALSGGERNRLLLARLFARPANLLVMDEPTNDLDIDTLELLEEHVSQFSGTLLLVSHDRAFLDQVVTSLLVLEGDGSVREFVGGYSDWAQYRLQREVERRKALQPAASAMRPAMADNRPKRLSYKEQRELGALPEQLQMLEAQRQALESELADPALYRGAPDASRDRLARLSALTVEIDSVYRRWEALEARVTSASGP